MKYMYVIYDCDVCEEFHILKATWTFDCEMDMKEWSLDMTGEVVASLGSQLFQAFCKIHHPNKYTNSRVMFSQVFEGEENEKETSQATE